MQKPLDPISVQRTEPPSASYVLRRRYGPARHVIVTVTWLTVFNLLFQSVVALAGTSVWGGGSGNWTGGAWTLAEPTATDDATFPSTGGTITLSSGETALSLGFSDSYTLLGGTLTLGATGTGSISVSSGKTVTIATPVGGSVGLTKSDSGVLLLADTATYSGTTTISSGTLKLNPSMNNPPGSPTLWFDATDPAGTGVLPANGATVGTWVNKGSAGSALNAASGAGPVFTTSAMGPANLPVLRFNGSNQYLDINNAAMGTLHASPHSMFVVARRSSLTGDGGLLCSPGWDNNFNIADDGAAFSLYANQWTGSNNTNMEVNGGAGSYTAGTTVVLDRIVTGTTTAGPSSLSLYKDGLQVGATATSTLKLCYKRWGGDTECANILSVGSSGTVSDRGRANYLGGDIAEVLIYNSELSAADRQTVEAYLAAKWTGGFFGAYNGPLPSTTALSIASGANFDLNGAAQTLASLGDSGGGGSAVINSSTTAAATLTLNGSSTSTFTGTVGGGTGNGAVNLATAGSGTFSQTFSGAVTGNTLTTRNANATLTFNHASTTIARADLLAGGTVNAATPVTVTSKLLFVSNDTAPKTIIATLSGSSGFKAGGANLADKNSDRTLTLSGGTLTLVASEAPALVTESSMLWFDASNANTITKDGSNKVSTWNSRSTGTYAGAYALARKVSGGNNTLTYANGTDALYNATGGPSSLPAIQLTSNNFFNFKTAGGVNLSPIDIRSVFWVYNGGAWMLGNNESTNGNGSGGPSTFHRGATGYGANAADPILNGSNGMNWRKGTTTMASVNPLTEAVGSAWSIFDAIHPGSGVEAGSIGLANYTISRTGNFNVAEVIVFNTTLSATDRDAVEAYLKSKWIDGGGNPDPDKINLPKTHIAATASSTLDLGAASVNHTLGNITVTEGTSADTILTVNNLKSLTIGTLTIGIKGANYGQLNLGTGTALTLGNGGVAKLAVTSVLPTVKACCVAVAKDGSFSGLHGTDVTDNRGRRWSVEVRNDGTELWLIISVAPGCVLLVR